MHRGFSVHIGANILSQPYRAMNLRDMPSAKKDAEDMQRLLPNSFTKKLLTDMNASTVKVKEAISDLTKGNSKLTSGDILVITYAGHGGQIFNEDSTEPDCREETWCLYDTQLIDDELQALWSEFNEGVRILVISDSCHSGTILDFFKKQITDEQNFRLINEGFDFSSFERYVLHESGFDFINLTDYDKSNLNNNLRILNKVLNFDDFNLQSQQVRTLPLELLKAEYQSHILDYISRKESAKSTLEKNFINNLSRGYRGFIRASVILISACQDDEKAIVDPDTMINGFFTKNLLALFNSGVFNGNYLQLHRAVWERIKSIQNPNYYKVGIPNPGFELETPFTI